MLWILFWTRSLWGLKPAKFNLKLLHFWVGFYAVGAQLMFRSHRADGCESPSGPVSQAPVAEMSPLLTDPPPGSLRCQRKKSRKKVPQRKSTVFHWITCLGGWIRLSLIIWHFYLWSVCDKTPPKCLQSIGGEEIITCLEIWEEVKWRKTIFVAGFFFVLQHNKLAWSEPCWAEEEQRSLSIMPFPGHLEDGK